MIIFGAMLSIAVLMLFIMLFAFCFKKGKKKLPPADVIPEVSFFNSFVYITVNDSIACDRMHKEKWEFLFSQIYAMFYGCYYVSHNNAMLLLDFDDLEIFNV